MTVRVDGITALRASAGAWGTALQWVGLPWLIVTGIVNERPWEVAAISSAVLALAVTLVYGARERLGTVLPYAVALGAVAQVSLLVMVAAGPWQIDYHMIYFAALATLVAFCDWRVVLVGALATAVHHAIITVAMPWAVFPDGTDLWRALFHAAIVTLEVSVLMIITHQLARAFRTSQDAADQAAVTAAEAEDWASRCQDREETSRRQQDGMEHMIERFNRSVVGVLTDLVASAQGLNSTAQTMTKTAQDTRARSGTVAETTAQASENVQTVASAAEELTASLAQARARVDDAAQIARAASAQSTASNAKIGELHSAAQAIGDVVTLIHGIAEQTNLLALNATIEAARAGEAGKGFAVVASEVKSLATQTAEATQKIDDQIATIRSVIADAVSTIQDVARTIDEINTLSAEVNHMVSQQSDATNEIARNVQHAADGTGVVFASMDEVRISADETGAAAVSVENAATHIVTHSESLRQEVSSFLEAVREAGRHRLFDPAIVDLDAELCWPDRTVAGRVVTLSALEAEFTGAPAAGLHEAASLRINGIDLALPCTVHQQTGHTVQLRFDLRPNHLNALIAFTKRWRAQRKTGAPESTPAAPFAQSAAG